MPMHIPDGFLSTPVWATLNVTSIPALSLLARRAKVEAGDSRVPLFGILGAFVFAAQMVNFPVGFGTSGHLIGGTLLACTVGPSAAALVMSAILVVQALLFQDGGVLALGANVMSMAVLGVIAGYLPYHFAGRGRFRYAALFIGGVLSVLTSALAALAFLYTSGVSMPRALLGVPAVVFLINGLLEGAITVGVVRAVERINPRWLRTPAVTPRHPATVLVAASLLLACCGFLIASAQPDGLERLSETIGLANRERVLLPTPLADYNLSALSAEWAGRMAAGLIGLAVAYLVTTWSLKFVARLRKSH